MHMMQLFAIYKRLILDPDRKKVEHERTENDSP